MQSKPNISNTTRCFDGSYEEERLQQLQDTSHEKTNIGKTRSAATSILESGEMESSTNSISDSGESSSFADVTTFAASYDSDVMESGTIVSISEDSEASIDAACGERRARKRRARERRAACGMRWRWCAVAAAARVLSGERLAY